MNSSLAIGRARAKRNRAFLLGVVLVLVFPALSRAGAGTARRDPLGALEGVPGIATASGTVATASDGDSAILAGAAGEGVDVPKDASTGVTVDPAGAPPLELGLPGAARAAEAAPLSRGAVIYEGTAADADTVVQVLASGRAKRLRGARILTVIYGPAAPSEYAFRIRLGRGETLARAGRGFVVRTAAGDVAARIAAPWARDADGVHVPVSYVVSGTTLRLRIDHLGAAYPVVADPTVILDGGDPVPPPPGYPDPQQPPPPDPAPDPEPAPAPQPKIVLDWSDPTALLGLVQQLLGSTGTGLWDTVPRVGKDAVQSFLFDGGDDATAGGMALPVPAVLQTSPTVRCRAIVRTERYKNAFGIALWEFQAGFAFCYDGTKITYVSKAIVKGSGHLSWRYLGLVQPATFIGGPGYAFVAMTAQGAMEICVPFLPLCPVRRMTPWVEVHAAGDGSASATGHV